ncbi:MAG: hypothetical protein ACREQA_04300 [Candidatus Binatia bacterium]
MQKSISFEGKRFYVGNRVQVNSPSGMLEPYVGTVRAIGRYGGLQAMNVDGMIITWEMFFFMKKLPKGK